MAAGYSRVQVFDPKGHIIAELDRAATVRSWALDDVGRCDFTVSTRDPQATPQNLNYGNFVLVSHKPSVNADGTLNGQLPPWVGMILAPQEWEYGKVKVTAYGAENLLFYRPMPFTTLYGSGSLIFAQILALARNPIGFNIQVRTASVV